MQILEIQSSDLTIIRDFHVANVICKSDSYFLTEFTKHPSLILQNISFKNITSEGITIIRISDSGVTFSGFTAENISLDLGKIIDISQMYLQDWILQGSFTSMLFSKIMIPYFNMQSNSIFGVLSAVSSGNYQLLNVTFTSCFVTGSILNYQFQTFMITSQAFLKDVVLEFCNYTSVGFLFSSLQFLSVANFSALSNNIDTGSGSSCIQISSIFAILISNSSFIQCQSVSYAAALQISVDAETLVIDHQIYGCEFSYNVGNFQGSNSQSAVYFSYLFIKANLSISNCTFAFNVFNSSLTETEASSALIMVGIGLNATLSWCRFLNNTSSDISSAIFFSLQTIYASGNFFSGNTYSDDSNFYGTLYTGAIDLHFLDNLFLENIGVDGVCIKVYEESTGDNDVYLIKRTLAIRNSASYQAGFMSRDAFQAADVTISESYFIGNMGAQYSGCFYFGTLYNTPTISILIIDCLFEDNISDLSGGVLYTAFSGEDIVLLLNRSIFLNNQLEDLTSIYPQGGMSDIWGFGSSLVAFNSCISYYNRASNGGFLSMVEGQVADFNSTYIENFAAMLGGNYFLSSSVKAQFRRSNFIKNTAKLGGSFFVHHDSQLILLDCNLKEVYANRGGVFMLDLSSQFDFEGLNVFNISGDLGALIYLTNTNGLVSTFSNSDVSGSRSTISLIYCEQADLVLEGLIFSDMESTIYHFHLSLVLVSNNTVNNVRCIENGEGCVVNVFRTQSLQIQNCQIMNMTRENTYDGGFIYAMESSVTLINISLENVDSQRGNSYGPIILGSGSFFLIKTLKVLNFQQGGLSLKESVIIIYNSSFENTNASIHLSQDALSCDSCLFLLINKTRFSGLQFNYETAMSAIHLNSWSSFLDDEAYLAAATELGVYWAPLTPKSYSFYLDYDHFIENNSSQAAAIAIYDSPLVLIQNSYFENNFASTFAGCIYLSFDLGDPLAASQVLIFNNTFKNNSAISEGGVLKWTANLSPNLQNNSFFNNYAIYGPEVASLPVRLSLRVFPLMDASQDSGSLNTSAITFDNLLNQETGFIINDHMSGDTSNCTLQLQLVDDRDQPILEANSRAEAEFLDGETFLRSFNLSSGIVTTSCPPMDSKTLDRFNFSCNQWLLDTVARLQKLRELEYVNNKTTPVSLDLTLQKNSSDGRIFNKAERIVLANTPTTFGFLIFRSKMVISTFYALINKPQPNEFYDPSSNSYALIIPVYFRHCNPGENYENTSNTCSICVKTRYSFNPFNNGCKLCPPNAECRGGMNVSLEFGFWRSSNFSDNIYKCEISLGSCQGGQDSHCLDVYTGRLCDICEGQPARNKDIFGFCSECLNEASTFFLFIFFFFLTFFLIAAYSGNVLLFGERKTEVNAIRKSAIKIIITFLQMFALMPVDNVPMPRFMFYYYKTVALFIYFMEKWIGSGCFSAYFQILPSRSHNTLLIYWITLILLAFFLVLYWNFRFRKLRKENFTNFKANVLKGLVFLGFFFQPSLLLLSFRAFLCIEVDGKTFAKLDMSQECWDSSYTLQTLCLNMPLILLFYIFFPLMPYYHYWLFRRKKIQLPEFKAITKDHYFFLGYKKSFAFWELVVLARKLLLITYVSLIDADGNSIAVAILILNISHLLQLYFKPYKYDRLNQFENSAYFVVTLNYYFLLFFYIEETNASMDYALFIISLLALITLGFFTLHTLFYQRFEEKLWILTKLLARVFGRTNREQKIFDTTVENRRVKKK